MYWKLLWEVFPFLWECFFGKKITKETPPSANGILNAQGDGEDKQESITVRILKVIVGSVQSSRRSALALIVLFFVSIAFNYHFFNMILAIKRDEAGKEVVTAPPDPVPPRAERDHEYYEHLINHLRTTYK